MTGWLITGAGGMLGREMFEVLTTEGVPVLPLNRTDLDLTDASAVLRTLRRVRPAVVVNCAGWTDVDGAERDEEAASAVNSDGTRHLARASAATGARLLHVSTDYVFSGENTAASGPPEVRAAPPPPYTEYAPTGPRTAYGRGKLAGEEAVLAELPAAGAVVRTAWMYGAYGRNFVRTMADRALADGRPTVDVVDDQHGQPTWTRDVARHLLALGCSARPAVGVFHSTSGGQTTWYEFAREVFARCGADPERVRPCTTADLGRPATRPAWSVLDRTRDHDLPGQPPRRHWREALAEAFPSVVPEVAARTSTGGGPVGQSGPEGPPQSPSSHVPPPDSQGA